MKVETVVVSAESLTTNEANLLGELELQASVAIMGEKCLGTSNVREHLTRVATNRVKNVLLDRRAALTLDSVCGEVSDEGNIRISITHSTLRSAIPNVGRTEFPNCK